jgi:hypothetical protein
MEPKSHVNFERLHTELAARCTELASESVVAEALRALALDYLARAAKLHYQTAD